MAIKVRLQVTWSKTSGGCGWRCGRWRMGREEKLRHRIGAEFFDYDDWAQNSVTQKAGTKCRSRRRVQCVNRQNKYLTISLIVCHHIWCFYPPQFDQLKKVRWTRSTRGSVTRTQFCFSTNIVRTCRGINFGWNCWSGGKNGNNNRNYASFTRLERDGSWWWSWSCTGEIKQTNETIVNWGERAQ